MEIRSPQNKIEWEDYYNLRFEILRKPLGQIRGSEKNEEDKIGIHLAIFEKNKIAAIARLDKAENNIGQVRFVASSSLFRGHGYGKLIMEKAEQLSINRGDIKMILHAREESVEFYLKLNYQLIEKSHNLFGQIQHFLMEKKYN